MLKGTTRQGIWHVLTGLVVPNKSLLPSWATPLQTTKMCSPAFPGAQPLWWTRPGSTGTSLHGGLKNTLGFCGGQGYKQNRQVSPSGSQQFTIKCLTDTLHPGTLPHLSCPELCPCTQSLSRSQSKASDPRGCFPSSKKSSMPVHSSPEKQSRKEKTKIKRAAEECCLCLHAGCKLGL